MNCLKNTQFTFFSTYLLGNSLFALPLLARGGSAFLPQLCIPKLCLGRPCFSSSDKFLFCWTASFSSNSWPLSFLSLFLSFFLFLRPCLIHARMPDSGRAFVHGHTFLHSWSGPMTLVVGLLHGATFLSNFPLVLFGSFIGPQ